MPGPSPTLLADLDALRSIIDAVPHTFFIKDADGRFVLVNQTMCALMGHSAEELVGRTDYDFVPKEQADVFSAMDRLVLEGGETNVNEELLSDPSGINLDKYNAGWLFEIEGSTDSLLDAPAYLDHLASVWEVTQRTIKGQMNEG